QAYRDEFHKNLNWLKNELDDKSSFRQVIVTHHLPSYQLQHPKYRALGTELLDTLFFSEILDKLDLSQVQYWFAGHTHESVSIKYKGTNIIVNPYGYSKEKDYRVTSISSNVHFL